MTTDRPGRRRAAGTQVSAAAIVVLSLPALYLVAVSWLGRPDGPSDDDTLAGLTAAAFVAAALAVVTALATLVPVLVRWLSAWWFVLPAALFVLAVVRMVHLDRSYPDLPDGYGLGR